MPPYRSNRRYKAKIQALVLAVVLLGYLGVAALLYARYFGF